MKYKIYTGWAFKLPYEYEALAGVLFFAEPPGHVSAMRTAVFRTREEARKAKKRAGGLISLSKIVQVSITIDILS